MDSYAFPPATSTPGTLHYIPPNLSTFEPTPPNRNNSSSTKTPPPNILLWIGGMFDTHHSVSYPRSHLLPSLPPTWSLHLASLRSAGSSWGVHTLENDVADISSILTYLLSRTPSSSSQQPPKIILMGHSTGCQDVMTYLLSPKSSTFPKINGMILQAPVSDRQALPSPSFPSSQIDAISRLAFEMVAQGHGTDCLSTHLTRPAFGRMGITAKRWLDVASPGPEHAGADDLFSSDLGDERLRGTFGKVGREGVPVCMLHMGSDESVPDEVDKEGLIRRWKGFVEEGGGRVDEVNSGIVEGASHNLNGNPDAVVKELAGRVVGFVGRVEREEFGRTSRI